MGKFEDTYPGTDAQGRTVKVNIKGSSYVRPVTLSSRVNVDIR